MKSLPLMMVLLLSGCSSLGVETTKVIDTGCNWVNPILISKKDKLTDGTARQILSLNETHQRICKK